MSNPFETSSPSWILVAEDDPLLQEVFWTKLVDHGFKVVQATTAADAIAKATRQRFACALIDLRLGRGNGEEIIESFRKAKGSLNLRTPIIIMSGFLEPDMIKRIGSRASAFLVKPFTPSDVIAKIQELVLQPRVSR